MSELSLFLKDILIKKPIKIIISKPSKINIDYKKIILKKQNDFYQEEKFTDSKVYHQTFKFEELDEYIYTLLKENFLQLNAFDLSTEYSIRITKKGKILFTKNKTLGSLIVDEDHNRKKNYIFKEGQIISPLIDMGIFTKEGKVVKSMYDKFKQINRFVEMVDDVLKNYDKKELNIIDFGCGKSYLTFILYYYFKNIKKINVNMIGLDLKEDVIESCNIAAKKYKYDNLKFKLGDISTFNTDSPVDMVITLHACDTATDQALFNAIKWNAKFIFSVPCCQHEFNSQISSDDFSIITRYGIIKEQISSSLTDAVRGNLLIASGYKTQLLEFVDLSHTPKNILIRAIKSYIPQSKKDEALEEVRYLKNEFNLNPTLLKLLKDDGILYF